MPPQLEEYIADFDENTFEASHPTGLEGEDESMEFNVERERAEGRIEMRRLLAEPTAEIVRQGIEAYKRDLPKLLAKGEEQNLVAYHGEKRLGIAATREVLLTELEKGGILESEPGLYIKKIRRPDDDDNDQIYSGYTR